MSSLCLALKPTRPLENKQTTITESLGRMWRGSLVVCLLALLSLHMAAAIDPSVRHASSLIIAEAPAAAGPSNNHHHPDEDHEVLNTYSLTTKDVVFDTTPEDAGAGREGTTRIRAKLGPGSLYTPLTAITASTTGGLKHELADAWRFFKNYALAFARVSALNALSAGSTLFPRAGLALHASSLMAAPGQESITSLASYIAAAERAGMRDAWTHTAPPNTLLLVPGSSTGAIADIMAVEVDEAAAAVTLTLDVVHAPKLVNELNHHGKQTLDDHAHYHFFTPEGFTVDAAAFLQAVRAAGNKLPALHMFAKGKGGCTPGSTCRPSAGECDIPEKCAVNGTCPEEDKVKPAGTPCRGAHGSCEYEATCDGTSATCHRAYKGNGSPCLYDFVEEHIFYPFAQAASDSTATTETTADYADRDYERDPYGERWPLCEGTCQAGKCVLGKNRPGCCYVGKHAGGSGYAETENSADTAATTIADHYARENLMCW